jgi:hypothetical protein
MPTKREHLVDIDPETLTYVSGWARIRRSIRRILLTRLRTRVMRLWWGSEFLDAQDKPINVETMMDSIIAASDAINRYEPEFNVRRVIITQADAGGNLQVRVEGVDLIDQQNRIIEETL